MLFSTPLRERLFRIGRPSLRLLPLIPVLALGPAVAQPAATPPGSASAPLVSRALTQQAGLEGRLIWVDGYANLDWLATRAGIAGVVAKMKQARLNTIVFGAKMFGGQTLYPSEIAPPLTEWKGQRVPPGHDMLGTVIAEAHARGLKVHAAVDVFSEGHRHVRAGPAYDHPELQTILYTVRRELVAPDGQRLPIYAVNTVVDGEVVMAFTPGYGWRKPRNTDPDETQVLAVLAGPAGDMRIVSVTDCALMRDGQAVEAPSDGLLLHGRGQMGDWMLRNLRPSERVQFVTVDKFIPIGSDELEGTSIFLNPVNPEVRARAIRILEEIVRKYDVDGISLDRMRFSGFNSDFSDYSRARFEEAIGQKVERWPDDIFKIDPIPGRPVVRGPLYGRWIEWRAAQITSFLKEAVAAVRAIKPDLRVGAYVGSWYHEYWREGVNWASNEYSGGYDWMTATYGQTGYAQEVDYITTGCYYPRSTAEAALLDDAPPERTVEMAAQLSSRAVSDAAFVYAGLYLIHYKESPEALKAAIAAARQSSQGVMLFDTVYVNQYGYWNVLEEVFTAPSAAPHDVPGLLESVRQVRKTIRSAIPGK